MWVNFKYNSCANCLDGEWIEAGDTRGPLRQNGTTTYWEGHFLAYQLYNSTTNKPEYTEFKVGSSLPTGTHNFSIQLIGPTSETTASWGVYVDGARALTISPVNYLTAAGIDVGIESNNTTYLFKNGTYASSLKWQDYGTGSWNLWTSATNGDSNPFNPPWTSTFSYANGSNKVVFNR